MNNWPWEELGLPGPVELPVIRRAYAERLKETRPEENPEGFQRLHNAYQAACQLARRRGAMERTGENSEVREKDGPSEAEPLREWDFERLFAEGAAEERGRRFQKLWALRQKNHVRYAAWRPTPSSDPAEAALIWIAVSRAISLVEELASSGAESPVWNLFCKSELFRYVRNQPDFVFALEDFLRECPELSESVCRVLFLAYGFDKGPVPRECRLLCQLLRKRLPDTNRGLVKTLTRRKVRGPLRARRWSMFFLIFSVLMMNLLIDFAVLQGQRKEWVRDWMAQDFGGEFVRVGHWEFGETCTLWDMETPFFFQARWDGPRDIRQGRRGYVTNYTQVRMSWTIADFAGRRDCSIFPQRHAADFTRAGGNWSEDYLRFPLTGAGEDISALGDLLSDVRKEAWYQALPPDYVLYLCWQDWSFCAYNAQTDDFETAALRQYYERFFGPDLCRIVLEETDIAASDMGEAFFLFPESGTVTIENRHFFHVVGVEKTHFRPRYHYFLSEDGTELFCVPTGGKVSELTLRDLYRMDRAGYEVKGFPETLSVFRDAGDTS